MKTLFRVLAHVPLIILHALGAAVGWVSFVASPVYRRRFLENARQAGLVFSEVRGAIAESGKLIAEVPRLWFGRPVHVEWENEACVEEARGRGKGIVFLTPHLGSFEVAAQGYAQRYGQITVLYRPARKAWLRDLVDTSRARANLATVPTTLSGVRQMLKALKAGQAVGLLPDQVPPAGLGEWAPFFGRNAYTMTLSARLAQQTGACIVLIWAQRLSWGRGFRLHVRPWNEAISGDPAVAASQVNARMESLIRECPAQYLWGYARYKAPRSDGPVAKNDPSRTESAG
ncbi:lysophospholipid acyltransferase family protein [Caenimonas koreensis]|uniref:Lysophospholipid acyltransferase family protein n=1 Tax=Caenimonas koreensis DSM 17982 TaxID=1121255 RepID=A0A844AXK7_9BURK|nr:lysophospholipid acyltransferase family protein [Caenimonas koreensis]MRD47128.1 lysophospholipid acyltransferase family protein [Caenimonas koreensis DSM 17982]